MRYGINAKTVAKWCKRSSVIDLPPGPQEPRSTVLTRPRRPLSLPSGGTPSCR
jgi:hypothetical protein